MTYKWRSSVRQILKDCFEVGYWLGKAGADEHNDNCYRQKKLAVGDCARRIEALLSPEEKNEQDT